MTRREREIVGKLRHLSGWKKDCPDHRDKKFAVSFTTFFTLPKKSSVRGQPGLRVEDQTTIGSCTCNSGTTAEEFALKKSGVDIQLSRLWAYVQVRKLEGTPLTEDSGAQIRNVMKVLAKIGCPPEASWPHDVSKLSVDPPAALLAEAATHQVQLYYNCGSLRAIKASIAQGFPVVGGFAVPENMFSTECTKTGVIQHPTSTEGFEGGHAVLFTGYDDSTQLLEFLNSWSEGWGNGGYGYLPYSFVKEGLATDFWTIRRVET